MHMSEFSFIYPNFARINFPKIMNRILYILGIAMSILTLASCNDNIPQPDEKLKGNTVIVYMGAENSLQKFSYYDLQEMQMGMQDIPENCQVVVYRDAELKPSIFLLNRKGITTSQLPYPITPHLVLSLILYAIKYICRCLFQQRQI